MSRLPIITDGQADALLKSIYDATGELLGFVSNSTRTMAHSPWIAKWWVPFIAAVTRDCGTVIDPSIRCLAMIKTSMLNSCEY